MFLLDRMFIKIGSISCRFDKIRLDTKTGPSLYRLMLYQFMNLVAYHLLGGNVRSNQRLKMCCNLVHGSVFEFYLECLEMNRINQEFVLCTVTLHMGAPWPKYCSTSQIQLRDLYMFQVWRSICGQKSFVYQYHRRYRQRFELFSIHLRASTLCMRRLASSSAHLKTTW